MNYSQPSDSEELKEQSFRGNQYNQLDDQNIESSFGESSEHN